MVGVTGKSPQVVMLLQERDARWSRKLNCSAADAKSLTAKHETQAMLFDEAHSVVVAVYRHGREVPQS